MTRAEPSVQELVDGVRAANRTLLARAITLVESARASDRTRSHELLSALLPETRTSIRVGISGPPGVGKSTLIEALGELLVDAGHRVGVLTVDPSSTVSGGSILGDKARMDRLSQREEAFIRPSPSANELGGVARRSREALLILEAAGYDVLLVETVGVGQSEVLVHAMTDHFVVLAQPGSGDELQGIKRGILELAHFVCVHKADGERLPAARQAATQLSSALRIARGGSGSTHDWRVLMASSKEHTGLDVLWSTIAERDAALSAADTKETRRAEQRVVWMQRAVRDEVARVLAEDQRYTERVRALEDEIRSGALPPSAAEALVRDVLLG